MRILTAFCLILCSGTGTFAQCRAPQYHVGVTLANSKADLIMSISIPLQQFAPSGLICLATDLKERYRGRNSIIVNIFSSQKAASRSFVLQEYTRADLEMFAQMHARYVFFADRHEDYLEILPAGATPSLEAGPYGTRIDLPVVSAPHCRLELDNRCLVALEEVVYPYEALKRKVSGVVTLTGLISRSGKVNRVRVVKTKLDAEGEKDLLANAAVPRGSPQNRP